MGYAQVQTATGGLPASTFEEMFRHHYRKCVTFAYRFVRSREDAEDLTQEAFLRAYRAFDRYDCKRPFDSWMFRIIANLFIDHLRKQRKMTLYSLDAPLPGKNGVNRMVEIPDSTTDPANVLLRDVLDERLLQALDTPTNSFSPVLRQAIAKGKWTHSPLRNTKPRHSFSMLIPRRVPPPKTSIEPDLPHNNMSYQTNPSLNGTHHEQYETL